MLTFGTGPEPVPAPTSGPVRVEEIATITKQRIAAAAATDSDVPVTNAIASELAAARDAYAAGLDEARALIGVGGEPDVHELERAAEAYVRAAQRAAGCRAMLVAARLRPVAEKARGILNLLVEAEGRVDPVRATFDEAAMHAAFRKDGLL